MKKTEFHSARLSERYACIEHPSGLRIYHFPKKMSTVYALFAVQYGSLDNCFSLCDGDAPEILPDGVAHFLEHKLFDNADGTDAFARFSALGADANAYTTYNRTAYLFSCTEHFEESLEELLSFVSKPYFTEQTVKKEQGIIAEEIRMYEDSPWERVYQNLLAALYHDHPVRKNICGSVASIQRITPDLLYRAHGLFYTLSNMALVICGDVTEEQILAAADRVLPLTWDGKVAPVRSIPTETDAPHKRLITATMQVAKPIFHIGIKDTVIPESPEARVRRDFAMTMLNELLFSQAGEFYSTLFEEGLITPSFAHGYSSAEGFAFNCISGESDRPQEVVDRFWEYLERVKREGLSDEDVERTRRVLYSDEVRAYDSTEEIANRLLSFVFEGADIFSSTAVINDLTRAELETLLNDFYRPEQTAVSVVYPLEDESENTEKEN